jgi:hypothetical protein
LSSSPAVTSRARSTTSGLRSSLRGNSKE